jgi:hypothetical protein
MIAKQSVAWRPPLAAQGADGRLDGRRRRLVSCIFHAHRPYSAGILDTAACSARPASAIQRSMIRMICWAWLLGVAICLLLASGVWRVRWCCAGSPLLRADARCLHCHALLLLRLRCGAGCPATPRAAQGWLGRRHGAGRAQPRRRRTTRRCAACSCFGRPSCACLLQPAILLGLPAAAGCALTLHCALANCAGVAPKVLSRGAGAQERRKSTFRGRGAAVPAVPGVPRARPEQEVTAAAPPHPPQR